MKTLPDLPHIKFQNLKNMLLDLKKAMVAFSGGVDSTFLLACAHEALGDNALAITGTSLSFPNRELKAAQAYTSSQGIEHILVDSEELNLEGFQNNPPNRCYLCKRELFSKIIQVAKQKGVTHVLEASNVDDEGDYRPGLVAIKELGVLSPLRDTKLCKAEIRSLSAEMGLPTWNKPSFACLASRFPYGETITPTGLARLDLAEEFLLSLGFYQVRVRLHEEGSLARVETDPESFSLLMDPHLREVIGSKFKELGFRFTAFDILGYRTGSMNATLPKN
ncbi:MAG: ATP-dependent sacrificial sulfur transferase LarE [Deltaproteobacteria bacterium]|nr:ATP-dependent sacrificial sulfur transferase LarE [Deltaproteobacteria bacterium]